MRIMLVVALLCLTGCDDSLGLLADVLGGGASTQQQPGPGVGRDMDAPKETVVINDCWRDLPEEGPHVKWMKEHCAEFSMQFHHNRNKNVIYCERWVMTFAVKKKNRDRVWYECRGQSERSCYETAREWCEKNEYHPVDDKVDVSVEKRP